MENKPKDITKCLFLIKSVKIGNTSINVRHVKLDFSEGKISYEKMSGPR